MSIYKKMRETSSAKFISLEIQKLTNVISISKISLKLKQRQNTSMRLAYRKKKKKNSLFDLNYTVSHHDKNTEI